MYEDQGLSLRDYDNAGKVEKKKEQFDMSTEEGRRAYHLDLKRRKREAKQRQKDMKAGFKYAGRRF